MLWYSDECDGRPFELKLRLNLFHKRKQCCFATHEYVSHHRPHVKTKAFESTVFRKVNERRVDNR
jgi:hypothetical protein